MTLNSADTDQVTALRESAVWSYEQSVREGRYADALRAEGRAFATADIGERLGGLSPRALPDPDALEPMFPRGRGPRPPVGWEVLDLAVVSEDEDPRRPPLRVALDPDEFPADDRRERVLERLAEVAARHAESLGLTEAIWGDLADVGDAVWAQSGFVRLTDPEPARTLNLPSGPVASGTHPPPTRASAAAAPPDGWQVAEVDIEYEDPADGEEPFFIAADPARHPDPLDPDTVRDLADRVLADHASTTAGRSERPVSYGSLPYVQPETWERHGARGYAMPVPKVRVKVDAEAEPRESPDTAEMTL